MSSQNTNSVFSVNGFAVWLLSRFFSNFGKQMRSLIVMWQVYALTKDPLMLGYIGLAEALPYVAVALWVGQLTDRREKKGILLLSMLGHLFCAVALILISLKPQPSLLLIYLVIGLAGVFTSYETVSSSAYVQIIMPKEIFPRAIAWHLMLFQVATIAGPLLGGWALSRVSPVSAYGGVAVLTAVSVLFTLGLGAIHPQPPKAETSGFESIKEGLRYIKSHQIILAAMTLDMLAVLFGDVVAILPIFAEMLGGGAIGLGFLRAAPAAGSLAVAIYQASHPVVQPKWDSLLRSSFVFGAAIVCFALSKNIVLSCLCLMIGGMADGVSVVIRQSIYQAYTPDRLRGRVASVSGIFIRTSNEIGAFESGLAAKLLGTVPSVIFGGGMTLLVAGFMKWKYPKLDKPETDSSFPRKPACRTGRRESR
ncbi:MAG: MFS transporter [Elusimicrobia bacterium]|nr:MFS transporter [Candidatus Obscuribacterium magneticum]MCB4756350.1 MFS transporter [Candidatus Obscuribacterium magneticum]